ncbi:hypothetical protein PC118_g21977 [Phytophthora cactorum]|uniref:Uncharacterized protein n=1 Tax=Phytophthora cactorum TaxID=29920 RepID=A0A8T1EUK4_9STRA|nr:hypothetical protein PC118_g21977 [Phytophthora cactorum]
MCGDFTAVRSEACTSVRWHVQSRVTEFVIADQDELDARHTYGMPVPDREVIDTRHLVGLDYRRLWKYIRATRAMETMSLRSRNLLIIPICTDGGQ